MGKPRFCEICGKRKYRTEHEARGVISRMMQGGKVTEPKWAFTAYKCTGGWHVGHNPKAVRTFSPRRACDNRPH